MTFTAPFAQTNKTNTSVCTTAGTIIDDTPTETVLLATSGAEGALLTSLTAMPRDTATATALYLFTSTDNGTTKRLLASASLEAYTADVTVAVPMTVFDTINEANPVRLEAGVELYVSTGVANASGIVFTSEMVDF